MGSHWPGWRGLSSPTFGCYSRLFQNMKVTLRDWANSCPPLFMLMMSSRWPKGFCKALARIKRKGTLVNRRDFFDHIVVRVVKVKESRRRRQVPRVVTAFVAE